MQEHELVQLLDSYMGNDGYYMKPKIADNENSFFMAKGPAQAPKSRVRSVCRCAKSFYIG